MNQYILSALGAAARRKQGEPKALKVLEVLLHEDSISIYELSRKTGFKVGTVHSIVNKLQKRGIVQSVYVTIKHRTYRHVSIPRSMS